MASLVPCPACQRHVRVAESACPFCSVALPSAPPLAAIPGTTQRLSRAAAFAFGASLTLASCSSSQALYGAPFTPPDAADANPSPGDTGAVDAAADVTTDVAPDVAADVATSDTGQADAGAVDTGVDVPVDDGGLSAMYGGPPQDAGFVDAPDADSGGAIAAYGAPPPRDAGGGGVRYGAPPPRDT